MYNLNIDLASECLKTLTDNNRCITCDNLDKSFVRYPCGHTVCADCVKVAECCLLCITPPTNIINFNDESLSLRAQHVSELVLAFQDLFGVDVNRRSNISKQSKLEKLLFPECIQAPKKYYNKRKSSNSFHKRKENIKPEIVLPGEEVTNSFNIKMENKNNYITKWLNNIENPINSKNVHRKPFADLNVNCNQQECFTKESQVKGYRKRKHFKTISCNTENQNTPQKKIKNEISKNVSLKNNKNLDKSYQKQCEADESGIVIDDDVVEIMDSQLEVTTDKDKLACMAVAEAELDKDEAYVDVYNNSSYLEKSSSVSVIPDNINTTYKVPFYRKSFLHKISYQVGYNNKQKNMINSKNVTITVDSQSFFTTINVSNSEQNIDCTVLQSTFSNEHTKVNKLNIHSNIPSQYQNNHEILNVLTKQRVTNSLLQNDVKDCNQENENKSKTLYVDGSLNNASKGIIIKDSDTDSSLCDTEKETKITVEVHRPCSEIDYGVLSELAQNQRENRSRHAHREQTPLSTDSSDKENYDPNRIKRTKSDKKCNQKK